MKKVCGYILFLSLILGFETQAKTINVYVANNVKQSAISNVMCTKNNRICTVGKYVISSNSQKPLNINGNIVCTSDNRICTNGYALMTSNKTRYSS